MPNLTVFVCGRFFFTLKITQKGEEKKKRNEQVTHTHAITQTHTIELSNYIRFL